jgi:catechol 2,3-dioxygenase-like lactoylglutathione lyase family enzyme
MEQRISLVTLGVSDVSRAFAFYQRLGWRGQEVEETVFFQTGGIAVVLWHQDKLADDAAVPLASMAATQATSLTPTGTFGRSPTTLASPSATTDHSPSLISAFGSTPPTREQKDTPFAQGTPVRRRASGGRRKAVGRGR